MKYFLISLAALILLAGCVVPSTKPIKPPPPRVIVYTNVDVEGDTVNYYKPNTNPRGGTKGNFVIVRYPKDEFLPINPYRDLDLIPMKKTTYDYTNDVTNIEVFKEETGFIKDTRTATSNLSDTAEVKKTKKRKSQRKAEAAEK